MRSQPGSTPTRNPATRPDAPAAIRRARDPVCNPVWATAWLAGCLMVALALAANPVRADTLRVGGAGASTKLMELLAAAYQKKFPQDQVVIHTGLGSTSSIKALKAGAVDLALPARAPVAHEMAGTIAVEYARSPFVAAVAASHPVSAISSTGLARLYEQADTRWPDGRRVRLILRPRGNSDDLLFRRFSPDMARALDAALTRTGAVTSPTEADSNELITKVPGAIGSATLTFVQTGGYSLKGLTIDGKVPSVAAIRDGSYPHYKRFFMLARSAVPPVAARFMEFVTSPEGAQILAAHGCWVERFPAFTASEAARELVPRDAQVPAGATPGVSLGIPKK